MGEAYLFFNCVHPVKRVELEIKEIRAVERTPPDIDLSLEECRTTKSEFDPLLLYYAGKFFASWTIPMNSPELEASVSRLIQTSPEQQRLIDLRYLLVARSQNRDNRDVANRLSSLQYFLERTCLFGDGEFFVGEILYKNDAETYILR